MKHNIDDAQLQAAIDEAFEEAPLFCTISIDKRKNPSTWLGETSSRLALAKSFLARLPKPTTPAFDSTKLAEAILASGDVQVYGDGCSNRSRDAGILADIINKSVTGLLFSSSPALPPPP